MSERRLIVNADDFGRSAGINRGVIEAHERGILTSASLMVLWPPAVEAASYASGRSALSLGLHLDLGEWAFRDAQWMPVYERAKLDDRAAVGAQVERQLAEFRRLAGADPTHLDSHHHVHREEPVAEVLSALGAKLGVPVRDFSEAVRYCGDFYGQGERSEPFPRGISVERLVAILESLPPGTTELGCHPGYASDFDTTYGPEREVEIRTLCDPAVRAALDEAAIELRTFADLGEFGGIHC